jgi:hypothetical protein
MKDRAITLKTVGELLGMNFFIPDYQRGYRWEKQQAIDLLEDIYDFASKVAADSEEIYCIQPLVVSERADDILAKCKSPEATLEDIKKYIKKYIKGSWNVVDGQQRLTTIYLLLCCLDINDKYEIDYCTRNGSRDFLLDIESKDKRDAECNIDYYHMYQVYSTIKEWVEKKNQKEFDLIKTVLLNRVNFIWYQVDAVDEIAVFTRLNIGKIPLTDSELIKALFLNRANFGANNPVSIREFETLQYKIAVEWDEIEHGLQNDEFWAFLHGTAYNKSTRIDFILDSICKKDDYGLYKKRKERKERKERIGNDEHKTFRYFNEAISIKKSAKNPDWLNELWTIVKKYYQVFNEWYQDYRLYHYIGYLTNSSTAAAIDITGYVAIWDSKTKEGFVDTIKNDILSQLKKWTWISEIKTYKFEQDGNRSKRECIDILLLHNIETIIQQNEKLILEAKYNLPNFTKFPFHLYKKENWQVEHIRPNAGDDLKKEDAKKLYLSLAKQYFSDDLELAQKIDAFLQGDSSGIDYTDIIAEISQKGGTLADDDKNRIWNFVLLDEATNKEYGNQIFPVKRAFIINKENGKKIKYSFENGALVEKAVVPEVAFVPPCTKNVFSKLYTIMPTTMINWNTEDANSYWNDIAEKLKYYFNAIGIK